MPYDDIISYTNQSIPYLKYYFDALVLIFGNYGISEDHIRNIQRNMEEEIKGNNEYDYMEDSFELDLSDLDLS